MPTIDEKRVYTDNSGTETVYLAAGLGVVAVSVSDDIVGEFGVARRCRARDVAASGPLLAVATDEDVLLADRDATAESDSDASASTEAAETTGAALDFEATGFGPATAVGFDGEALLAGDESGRVGRYGGEIGSDANERGNGNGAGDESGGSAWTDVGATGAVRAIDGRLVAAADGVHRVGPSGATHAGLDDARDVDAEPLVATGSGLYKLGNGWMDVLSGPVDAVDAAGSRALAVRDGALYSRGPGGSGGEAAADVDGAWREEALSVDGDVVAVAHGAEAAYAVTDDGTFAVRLPDGEWRYRGLGVRNVEAAAV